jgi:hypothetical protein
MTSSSVEHITLFVLSGLSCNSKKNLASHDLYGYILLSRASIPPFENRKKKKTLRVVASRHEYDWRMAITPQKPDSIDLTSPYNSTLSTV